MDEKNIALLAADINAQRMTIERVFAALDNRANSLHAKSPPEKLESFAYQLHNLYGAIEDLFKVIAVYFENNISDSSQWHSRLLQRMTQTIEGTRPAVISQENYLRLNGLRAFWHFFRHAYGVPIDFAQLMNNLERAEALQPQLDQDLDAFLKQVKGT
ncbi:hypothetical protein PN498_05320 [Oscillatoria sp. CS-180]|uniref:ribonuclease toxin HepT-like protein n=1 Tax=Oscillatoria sp. CS-180 TaxID=3021720 RepID=UPI00232E8E1B|nr:hypothetical protein [Oscillatoria sp. CS-180]MDB9525397.1 hypothetical protein [Oscillatoria sp. CS-180]